MSQLVFCFCKIGTRRPAGGPPGGGGVSARGGRFWHTQTNPPTPPPPLKPPPGTHQHVHTSSRPHIKQGVCLIHNTTLSLARSMLHHAIGFTVICHHTRCSGTLLPRMHEAAPGLGRLELKNLALVGARASKLRPRPLGLRQLGLRQLGLKHRPLGLKHSSCTRRQLLGLDQGRSTGRRARPPPPVMLMAACRARPVGLFLRARFGGRRRRGGVVRR